MEALILTVDVVVMTYLCWRVYRRNEKDDGGGLGWLSYKDGDKP